MPKAEPAILADMAVYIPKRGFVRAIQVTEANVELLAKATGGTVWADGVTARMGPGFTTRSRGYHLSIRVGEWFAIHEDEWHVIPDATFQDAWLLAATVTPVRP